MERQQVSRVRQGSAHRPSGKGSQNLQLLRADVQARFSSRAASPPTRTDAGRLNPEHNKIQSQLDTLEQHDRYETHSTIGVQRTVWIGSQRSDACS